MFLAFKCFPAEWFLLKNKTSNKKRIYRGCPSIQWLLHATYTETAEKKRMTLQEVEQSMPLWDYVY